MHPVLHIVRAASFIVLSAVWQDRFSELVATKVAQKVGASQVKYETKEGTMAGTSSSDVSLLHLNPIPCNYSPKGIHTEAIQVTPENIGKLSLEFEEELFYGPDSRPFFVFDAQRGENMADGEVTQLYVRVTDWIVPLRGEIHIYRDQTFWTTFDLPTAVPTLVRDGEMQFPPTKDANLTALTFGTKDSSFLPNDYVRVKSTGEFGTVAVLSVEMADGNPGIEVLLNGGTYKVFDPSNLEKTIPPIKYVGETETFPNTGVFDEGQHRAE